MKVDGSPGNLFCVLIPTELSYLNPVEGETRYSVNLNLSTISIWDNFPSEKWFIRRSTSEDNFLVIFNQIWSTKRFIDAQQIQVQNNISKIQKNLPVQNLVDFHCCPNRINNPA